MGEDGGQVGALTTGKCAECGCQCVRSIGYCTRCIPPDPLCEHLWSDWTSCGDIDVAFGRARVEWRRGCELCGVIALMMCRIGKPPEIEDVSWADASLRG